MPCFHGVIRSRVMEMSTHLACALPDDGARGTLILLHGLSGNCEDWMRYTRIEQYARKRGLAVFMPEVQRSWYTDMAEGLPYFRFISEELPQLIGDTFKTPLDAAHLYIGGLSMGGFGALKCTLTHPERYAGCISLSSRFYLKNKLAGLTDPTAQGEWRAILGQGVSLGRENDLEALAAQVDPSDMPPVYLACGTEDALYPETVRMRGALEARGFKVTYAEWPGIHDWDFWDVGIERGLSALLGQ